MKAGFHILEIEPMGKPRMTQRDKWKKRPCVLVYHAFKDYVRLSLASVDLSDVDGVSWDAFFSMPKSWSKKKKEAMRGQPHQQKPDRDNIDKAILDALLKDDSVVWRGELYKYWDDGHGARIALSFKRRGEI